MNLSFLSTAAVHPDLTDGDSKICVDKDWITPCRLILCKPGEEVDYDR